jgi:hypothetical protein
MTHDEKMRSGCALLDCIDAFATRRKFPIELEVQFRRPDASICLGSVDIAISQNSTHDFPVLDCDASIMKSFGINYGNFDPRFQRFAFDKVTRELSIAGSTYEFILTEIKLRERSR